MIKQKYKGNVNSLFMIDLISHNSIATAALGTHILSRILGTREEVVIERAARDDQLRNGHFLDILSIE